MKPKHKIMHIINQDSELKNLYEDENNCFRLSIDALLNESEDLSDFDVLALAITNIAFYSKLYTKCIENISMYGSPELIVKCRNVICELTGTDENVMTS